MDRIKCRGGCHCGAVQFEFSLPPCIEVRRCTCSICKMSGYCHLTVAHEDFELISGSKELVEYRFNTGNAKHLFCRICGIKSFYQPRSHPQAWSVNFNCVELPDNISVNWGEFDGSNWETHIDEIKDIVN